MAGSGLILPMLTIEFPAPNFRTRKRQGAQEEEEIFDPIRKKWLLLTPEEWVRQNFVAWLVKVGGIPPSLIGLERGVAVGELKKRFDIVVFKNDGRPWMLVECKAMTVPLSENTVAQTLAYLSGMACPYAIITNGRHTFGWQMQGQNVQELAVFPKYSS